MPVQKTQSRLKKKAQSVDRDRRRMRGEGGQERSSQHMHENKETEHPAIKQIHTEASIYIYICLYG